MSGSKVVEARARVISEEDAELGNPMENFRDGDIIVAAMINPAWLPYFSRAGGFVSEVGGWLSHPAILAREYDVAMIVGTEGIGRIADGDRLRLNLDGRIEVMTEEMVDQTSRRRSGLRARSNDKAPPSGGAFFIPPNDSGERRPRPPGIPPGQANCRRLDLRTRGRSPVAMDATNGIAARPGSPRCSASPSAPIRRSLRPFRILFVRLPQSSAAI